MLDMENILRALSKKRPIFHSEADFQNALAWETRFQYPDSIIRLEHPQYIINDIFMDIIIKINDMTYGIELKYKTRYLSIFHENILYKLKDQRSSFVNRYDFLKDVERLEKIKKKITNFVGYAIFLTNDSAYWNNPIRYDNVGSNFCIHNNQVLKGDLSWNLFKNNKNDYGNDYSSIRLEKTYEVHWERYSKFTGASFGGFKYLVMNI